jgi:three-Cys-motif partner protein
MVELQQPQDDGLYIPEVGQWSSDKHYYLWRYMDAFTTSMRGKWRGLHYIDLFGGAGIERLRQSKSLEWGSPMLAAQTRFPFTQLHVCEKSRIKFKALKARIDRIKPGTQTLPGDANQKINDIIRQIPEKTLSLAFLDPYGLHLELETLKKLSDIRADLIIFFPDHLDALRNWEKHYLQHSDSNLDRCLGPGADWRSMFDAAPPDSRAEVLRTLYVQRIGSLGYTEFEYRRMYAKGHPLYVLIFCSRNPFAAKLWRRISDIESDNQRTLPF